jgi:molybdopterin-guanine dinucleotide biosynthesis protein A
MKATLDAVVLAGGQSTRMGQDKAWLPFRGRSLIAHQIETVRKICPGVILISGRRRTDYSQLECRILHDQVPNRGPLEGIRQALSTVRADLLLVLAVDMPLMDAPFLTRLVRRCRPEVGCVPRLNGRYEPLSAIYPVSALPVIESMFARDSFAAVAMAESCVKTGLVVPYEVSNDSSRLFSNWNTQADRGKGRWKMEDRG